MDRPVGNPLHYTASLETNSYWKIWSILFVSVSAIYWLKLSFQAILNSSLEGKMFLILSRIPLTNTNTLLRLAAYLEVNLSGSLMWCHWSYWNGLVEDVECKSILGIIMGELICHIIYSLFIWFPNLVWCWSGSEELWFLLL